MWVEVQRWLVNVRRADRLSLHPHALHDPGQQRLKFGAESFLELGFETAAGVEGRADR